MKIIREEGFLSLIKKGILVISHIEIRDPNSGAMRLNILKTFPLYRPNSSGTFKDRASLTIQTINQIFPCLSSLLKSLNRKLLPVDDITTFPKTDKDHISVNELKKLFDFYGSDKANYHSYHFLFGTILRDKEDIKFIFEIGLGTNHTDVVSNMNWWGKPGASLRAFRDYCVNAEIYGGDIDKRILFKDNRIQTFFIDQTNPATFDDLLTKIPTGFDLVIDDGLHSPDANINSLRFGLEIVKKGGWVVIEDIGNDAISLWQVVAALLPQQYKPYLFKDAERSIVFAVKRLD